MVTGPPDTLEDRVGLKPTALRLCRPLHWSLCHLSGVWNSMLAKAFFVLGAALYPAFSPQDNLPEDVWQRVRDSNPRYRFKPV